MATRPTFKIVEGILVRTPGDVRTPGRRYRATASGDIEFTDEEEAIRDAEEAQWLADEPKRAKEAAERKIRDDEFLAGIVYETRYVAFIDILGFSSAVNTSKTDAKSRIKIGLALNLLQQYARGHTEFAQKLAAEGQAGDFPRQILLTQFSDCLAVSASANLEGRQRLISTVNFLSHGLFPHGFLLRGGITVGDIYHRDNVIFGPAFNRAYELETKVAVHPRIIFDPDLPADWCPEDRAFYQEGKPLWVSENWVRSHDGLLFMNLLRPFVALPDAANYDEILSRVLGPVRALLIERLIEYSENKRVREKYEWLAGYFNEVCAKHPRCGLEMVALESKR